MTERDAEMRRLYKTLRFGQLYGMRESRIQLDPLTGDLHVRPVSEELAILTTFEEVSKRLEAKS